MDVGGMSINNNILSLDLEEEVLGNLGSFEGDSTGMGETFTCELMADATVTQGGSKKFVGIDDNDDTPLSVLWGDDRALDESFYLMDYEKKANVQLHQNIHPWMSAVDTENWGQPSLPATVLGNNLAVTSTLPSTSFAFKSETVTSFEAISHPIPVPGCSTANVGFSCAFGPQSNGVGVCKSAIPVPSAKLGLSDPFLGVGVSEGQHEPVTHRPVKGRRGRRKVDVAIAMSVGTKQNSTKKPKKWQSDDVDDKQVQNAINARRNREKKKQETVDLKNENDSLKAEKSDLIKLNSQLQEQLKQEREGNARALKYIEELEAYLRSIPDSSFPLAEEGVIPLPRPVSLQHDNDAATLVYILP